MNHRPDSRRKLSTRIARIGLAVLAVVVSGTDLTQAGTITLYDSLSAGASNGAFGLVSGGPFAESFSTGSSAVDLTDIQVGLQVAGNPATMTQSISVDLLRDSAMSPGATLTTLGTIPDNSLGLGGGAPIVTLVTPYSLAPNTRYWIELSAPVEAGNGGAGWEVYSTFAVPGPGVAGEFLDVFGHVGPTANSLGAAYFGSYRMKVTAQPHVDSTAAVPEPGSLSIFGLGLAVMVASWRRSKIWSTE